MGSDSSKQKKDKDEPIKINRQAWTDIKNAQHYTIVRDATSNREGQQYQFWLDHRYDPKNELKVYQERNKINAPIIKTYDVGYEIRQRGFADINQFNVITERIPFKFCDLPQLTYPQSLYALNQALNGYGALYQRVGSFEVNDRMIGLNPQGQVRVWLNSNFGKNQPLRKKPILLTTKSSPDFQNEKSQQINHDEQTFMIKNISSVIQNKCQEGRFPDSFRDQIYHNCSTFDQARNIIRREVDSKRLVLPNRIDYKNNKVLVSVVQSMGRPINTYNTSHITSTIVNNSMNVSQPVHVSSSNLSIQQRPLIRKSQLRFNYHQPKEYFHPQMYAR